MYDSGAGKWKTYLLIYAQDEPGKLTLKGTGDKMISSYKYVKHINKLDDWAIIATKAPLKITRVAAVATDRFDYIKTQELAITGYPASVRGNKTWEMWTQNGPYFTIIKEPDGIDVFANKINASEGNSGGPFTLKHRAAFEDKTASCGFVFGGIKKDEVPFCFIDLSVRL